MEIFKNCLNKQMIDYKNLRLKTYFINNFGFISKFSHSYYKSFCTL